METSDWFRLKISGHDISYSKPRYLTEVNAMGWRDHIASSYSNSEQTVVVKLERAEWKEV